MKQTKYKKKTSCKCEIKQKDCGNKWMLQTSYVNYIAEQENSAVSNSMFVIDFWL
jgi:hypothetical protein